MTLVERALDLSAAGQFVFPLSPGTKIPAKGSAGFHDASTDAAQIRKWWSDTPDANIGLATGIPSNVFVVDLDLDPDKDKDGPRVWATLEKQKGKAPETYTVQTPRGGLHLYFAMPDAHPIQSGTDKLGEGIDIRGDGGYVVAPPSTVDGKSYRVLNAAMPARPPGWLIEMLRTKPAEKTCTIVDSESNPRVTSAVEAPKILEALKFITPSNYDEWLKVGMALHQWNRQVGRNIWDEWSQQCPEKYDRGAIESKWRSFDDGNGNGTVTIGTLFHTAQQNGWKQINLPPIDNAADLVADGSIVLPDEIIEGFLHQGLKAALGSNSKARKTWILLDIATSVQAGAPWLKFETHQGRVLYINFEIPRPFIRSRIKRLCEAKGIRDVSNLDVWTLRGHSAPLWKLLPELLAKIQTGKYALIIIDPIYKGLGGRDENSAGDISELCNELERLAVATGAAVLYAAHFSKGNQAGKEAIDRISGSGVWARDADSIMTLTAHEEEGAYTVDMILRNLPEHAPFVVKWEFPLMRLADQLDPAKLKKVGAAKRYSADDLMEVLGADSMTTTEWLNAAKAELGISSGKFYELLRELQQSKRIIKSKLTGKWLKTCN